jgi:glycogenin glucosyltransferase
VSPPSRRILAEVFDNIVQVDTLDSSDPTHLALMARPELGITFTKLHCWNLVQYSKVVFLDADTLVLTNVDDLFSHPELSAAPDVGWPDCFNSGVLVLEPSTTTFANLLQFATEIGSFDGADQGLLNQFFYNWSSGDASHRLSFTYNMAATTTYSYLPAFLHYGNLVKIVHFLGSSIKPWDHRYNADNDELVLHPGAPNYASSTIPFLKTWWRIFTQFISPIVKQATGQDPQQTKTGEYMAPFLMAASTFPTWTPADGPREPASQQSWEAGRVDYTGADRFENIQRHLESVITTPKAAPTATPAAAGVSAEKRAAAEKPGGTRGVEVEYVDAKLK